jgi:hypothetical protein
LCLKKLYVSTSHRNLTSSLFVYAELARGATTLVRMSGNQTIITKPPEARSSKDEDVKAFTFDKSYWSADKNDSSYADQATVYNDLGEDLLDHAFDGYNCCIFACKLSIFLHPSVSKQSPNFASVTFCFNSQMVRLVQENLTQ